VPELIAKSVLEGRSLTVGTVTLAEVDVGPITSIAVLPGGTKAILLGVDCPVQEGAALTDQSDGWAVLSVSGAGAVDALARWVPLDLRLTAFPVGKAMRTQLIHMNVVILRGGDHAFEIMVFRSMARTAWHEIEAAMQMLAARTGMKF
jgi:heterotetrameric sarcosine oxidase gamma subunit